MIPYRLAFLSLIGLLSATAQAAGNPCAPGRKPAIDPSLVTRPAGYQPAAGDAVLGDATSGAASMIRP